MILNHFEIIRAHSRMNSLEPSCSSFAISDRGRTARQYTLELEKPEQHKDFMLLGFFKLRRVLPGSSSTVVLGGGNSMNSCSATPHMAQEGASDHCPTPPRNTLLLLLSTHEGRTQQRYGGSSCYYAACLNICARYSPACVLPSWSSMLTSYLWKEGHTVVGSMECC